MEAIDILQESAEVLRRRLEEHTSLSRILETLGHIYIWIEQPEKADECYQETLGIYSTLLPENHPKVLWTRIVLASSKRRQGKFQSAESLLMEIIPILLERHPEGNADLTQAVNGLVHILNASDREKDSQEWLQRVPT